MSFFNSFAAVPGWNEEDGRSQSFFSLGCEMNSRKQRVSEFAKKPV